MVQVLQHFGLTEIDGHLNYKLDAVPSDFVSVAPFDMMQYPDEKLATIPFAIYLTVGLDAKIRRSCHVECGPSGVSGLPLESQALWL